MKAYLGRPWRSYSSVLFLDTEMSEAVRAEGWNNWNQPDREKTSRYGEFNSTGPGANSKGRTGWARRLSANEARLITAEKVLGGFDGWKPKAR